ncbi:hypothetical protein [Ancylobacter sp. G4_0304]|uniref:hypothetical protein n=1 Tax=Ancylobacter sp. G4_0304 TaxID=3114289 RepID=UPI0039C6D8DA
MKRYFDGRLVAAALFALTLPAGATGMAEREPPAISVWLIMIGIAMLSWVMTYRRWWLPLAIWVPAALFVSTLIADFADPVIGPAVREELGSLYIFQIDLAGALMLVAPLMFANQRFSRQK